MNTNSYAIEAAEWWASQVQNLAHCTHDISKELEEFKRILSKEIIDANFLYGHVRISSFKKISNILYKAISYSNLSTPVPKGYEMQIYINKIYVYDHLGILVYTA